MIIDLPPHIEQAIIAKAKEQGLSVQEMIARDYGDDDIWLALDEHGLNSDEIHLNNDEVDYLMALLDNPPKIDEQAKALLFGNSHV